MNRLSFANAKPYKKFIEDRDRALDQILFKYRVASSNILDRLKLDVVSMLSGMYIMGRITFRTPDDPRVLSQLQSMFLKATRLTITLYRLAIRDAYILSHVAEAEAIGRVLKKRTNYEAIPPNLNDKSHFRVKMYFDKLNRKLLDAMQYAIYYAKDAKDFKDRMESAFPGSQVYKRPPRNLKPLKEASRPSEDDLDELAQDIEDDYSSSFHVEQLSKDVDMATGLVSQEDWDTIVEDYKNENIDPVTIFGREGDVFKVGGDAIYDWQLDNDLTHEFVTQVRSGQVDAANKNGIKDFVWIAVVDKKTDECCLWRDGLTTSEIEEKLSDHDNDCDGATNPPAHFNCRCRLAPYDDQIDDQDYMDSLPDYGEFDDWINS